MIIDLDDWTLLISGGGSLSTLSSDLSLGREDFPPRQPRAAGTNLATAAAVA